MNRFHLSFRSNTNISSEPDPDYEYEAVRVYRARVGYDSDQYVYVSEKFDDSDNVSFPLLVFEKAFKGSLSQAESLENKGQYLQNQSTVTKLINELLPEGNYTHRTALNKDYYYYFVSYDNEKAGLIWKTTGKSKTLEQYEFYETETGDDYVEETRELEVIEIQQQNNGLIRWVRKDAWESFLSGNSKTKVYVELSQGEDDYGNPQIVGDDSTANWILAITNDCNNYRWFEYNGLIYYIENNSDEYYAFEIRPV